MEGEKRDLYRDPRVVRKMAQLMMQGAVMLAETCPICGLPLFRLRNGDVVCPVHGRIIVVSSEEEAREVEIDSIVRDVEHYAARRVRESMEKGEPGEILDWLRVIEAAERIRGIRQERLRGRSGGTGEEKGSGGRQSG